MIVSQALCTRRTREFIGPIPGSVAVKARQPNKHPPENLILQRRKKDNMLLEYQKTIKDIGFNDLKNEWEQCTDRKFKINTCKQMVDSMMQNNQFSIEDRRERLQQLLQDEEEKYLHEMEEKEETTIERQAKMREKAHALKEKRESERLQFVQERYNQQFRDQCEELRLTLSKRHQDEMCVDRLEQIRIKDEIEQEHQEEEKMFTRLWEEDMLVKAAREERDSQDAHERNAEALSVLCIQTAALEAAKEEARRLKKDEAQLLREQNAIRESEEQRKLKDKVQQQRQTQEMFDLSLQLNRKMKAKAEQEELATDLKILEQLLEESRNEAMELMQRKKELREEDQRYREYLKQMMEDEIVKERELEALIQQEVERTWQKRMAHWKCEREARKKLLMEVLDGRALQVQRRLNENIELQHASEKECKDLLVMIEANRVHKEQLANKNKQKHAQYQSDLIGQIEYNQNNQRQQFERDELEYAKGVQAEREYQERLKACLDCPEQGKMHPMRHALFHL